MKVRYSYLKQQFSNCEDLWKKLKDLIKNSEIEWNWIKGHSDHPMNELADRLAKKATPI